MHQVSLYWKSSPHFLLGFGPSAQVSCGSRVTFSCRLTWEYPTSKFESKLPLFFFRRHSPDWPEIPNFVTRSPLCTHCASSDFWTRPDDRMLRYSWTQTKEDKNTVNNYLTFLHQALLGWCATSRLSNWTSPHPRLSDHSQNQQSAVQECLRTRYPELCDEISSLHWLCIIK